MAAGENPLHPARNLRETVTIPNLFQSMNMNLRFSQIRRGVLLAGLAAALPLAALAQGAYPNKPIRIVVPFPPGGSTDLLARRLGEKLSTSMGQPVLVENKPGAGGSTGADFVAKSPPDGYTLLLGVTGSNAIAASLFPKIPYDTLKDFTPVSQVVSAPLVLAVNSASPIKTVKDYVDAAKVKPVSYGTPGNGTSMHLAGEQFKAAAGVDITHVPYKESAHALTALIGGQIQATFHQLAAVLQQIKAGNVKALAVTSRQRVAALPDVPSIAESGFPNFESVTWYALYAPAKTPKPIIDKINAAVTTAVKGDLGKKLQAGGSTPRPSTPAELTQAMVRDGAQWKAVIDRVGAKLD